MLEFILREWKHDDADSLVVAANNPNIANNLRNTFPFPYTLDDAKWFIDDCVAHEGQRQITRAIVIDGKAVGSIGITLQEDVFEKSGELGYWLAEKYWRNGITTEAVQRICKEAFTAFDIVRIYAEPFECNAGSRGVLEKAGFTYEGTMEWSRKPHTQITPLGDLTLLLCPPQTLNKRRQIILIGGVAPEAIVIRFDPAKN